MQASWIASPIPLSTKNIAYSRGTVLPSRWRNVQYRFPA
jgi:hypothetical protein